MFLRPPPSDPKCPICKRSFPTQKGLSCHITKIHKGEMFDSNLDGALVCKITSPKRKMPQFNYGKPKKKLKREQKSKGRIGRTIRWKIRRVVQFRKFKKHEYEKKKAFLEKNKISKSQMSK